MEHPFRAAALLAVTALLAASSTAAATGDTTPSFGIKDDRFMLDGQPFQIISGAIHYFRVHPTYWKDRLIRCKALGLNTIEVYVPWNWHEPRPGDFRWSGFQDLGRFIDLIEELDMFVLVRAGPYICAEWDFGGFPSWLGSSATAGGATMRLRSSDPAYLEHVDRWWHAMLPRIRPRMRFNGGPVLMVQIENEYGSCGADKAYLGHLAGLAKHLLGEEALLYTTDSRGHAKAGSLPGAAVLSAVDFGPGWFYPDDYFAEQRAVNSPGFSPPFDSEFYTGWLTRWGEKMANTSAQDLAKDTDTLLRWANGTASLNFYMIHGGTNFGFTAGANVENDGTYEPVITSYDYDAPISEAGSACQRGIGGECKAPLLRQVIEAYTGITPPEMPAEPVARAYASNVKLQSVGTLMSTASESPTAVSDLSLPMEEYGQRYGIIVYRTSIRRHPHNDSDAVLDFGTSPSDFATVLVNGEVVGRLQRPGPAKLTLPASQIAAPGNSITMDVIVEAMGRQNFGCPSTETGAWDRKGLQGGEVTFDGRPVRGWEVYTFEFEDQSRVPPAPILSADVILSSEQISSMDTAKRRLLTTTTTRSALSAGPTFYRGTLTIEGEAAENVTDAGGETRHLADTFLDLTAGWGKGVAFVNGFNLGWYWASVGPQMTLYVPGPVLKAGVNDVLLLEVESAPEKAEVSFTDEPNFWGPAGRVAESGGASESIPQRLPSTRSRI